ncbi:MAG: hypothetical protein IT463_10790 [Planctomycetes bacterium]|nr:hypothetical protein [Planctomycetota bacterium]
METLVIVRKIREAETLADGGKHGDALGVLQPLLEQAQLTEAHRTLIRKKIEVLQRQQQRVTRILSRRSGPVADDTDSGQSSERTAVRPAVANPTSDRTTDVPVPKLTGLATEAVPRLREDPPPRAETRQVRTEVPVSQPADRQVRTEVPVSQPASRQVQTDVPQRAPASDRQPVVRDSIVSLPGSERRPPVPSASDSQELAPVSDEPEVEATLAGDASDTVKFAPQEPQHDTGPVLVRSSMDVRDTPVPRSPLTPPPVSVRDSFVTVRQRPEIPDLPATPDRKDHSTYILADEHFAPRAPSSKGPKSTPELKALSDRLPDDDLRRELALEVVRLREELDRVKGGSSREREAEPSRGTAPRIERSEKPASGQFHIPASQANTIVRRAVGSDRIDVHMPTRDENIQDLQVLRRDSVRNKSAEPASNTGTAVAAAQGYLETGQPRKSPMLRTLAAYAGFVAVVALVGWLVHIGWRSLGSSEPTPVSLAEHGLDNVYLGKRFTEYEDFSDQIPDKVLRQVRGRASGWLLQLNEQDEIVAITLPGPAHSSDADEAFRSVVVHANNRSVSLAEAASVDAVRTALGEPTPAFSESLFASSDEYSLVYPVGNGGVEIEFHYSTKTRDRPLWVRVRNSRAALPNPVLK